MCLDRIIKEYNPPLGEKRAWGVFLGSLKMPDSPR